MAKKTTGSILKEGQKAPAFTLPNQDGKKISLSELKGKKVVLFFYPKDLTPGCTQESCDFQSNLSAFKKKKTLVFGISKDSPKQHIKFIEKYGFEFDLLSDEDHAVCEKYGIWKEKSLYGKKYMGIERTTIVIDEDGKIEKIFAGVKVTGHVDEVLESI